MFRLPNLSNTCEEPILATKVIYHFEIFSGYVIHASVIADPGIEVAVY